MNIQDFTEKDIDLANSTEQRLHVIVIATDGKDISITNYGTDYMRALMVADFLSKESEEFFDHVIEVMNKESEGL